MMLDPRFWVAMFLLLTATALTMFGVGWHYGDKGKIEITEYTKLQSEKAKVDAALKISEANYAGAKATLAAKANDGNQSLAKAKADLETERKRNADLTRENLALGANLATARLMLGDVSDSNQRAARAAAESERHRTAESTDLAGRLDSCQSVYRQLVVSSGVNNAELKRAIANRDACVARYQEVQHRINGE